MNTSYLPDITLKFKTKAEAEFVLDSLVAEYEGRTNELNVFSVRKVDIYD